MPKIIDNINDWSGKIVGYFLYAGIVILLYEVVARYFFDSPTTWAQGMTERTFGTYFIISGAYCALHKAHIRVDIIYNKLSHGAQAILDIVDSGFLLLVASVMLVWGLKFAWPAVINLENSLPPFEVPIYPLKLMIPLAALLLLLQGLVGTYRSYLAFRRRHHGS